MVSTRRAPAEHEPAQPETQDPPSPSRKRSAEDVPAEERAEKRQQLSSDKDEKEVATAATAAAAGAAGVSIATGTNNKQEERADDTGNKDGASGQAAHRPPSLGPRAELQETAGELLKLYACTKSFEYLSAILSRPATRKGRQYKHLYEKFQQRRRGFRTVDNFIHAASLGGSSNGSSHSSSPGDAEADVGSQRFARCINFVTFAASMLGSRDASFQQLNDHFFEVFIDRTGAKSGRLLKLQADILLGLKTQAYIAQAAEKGSVQESLLNELFPSDMTSRLAGLQPDPSSAKLVQSEQTFVKQLIMRKRHLKNKDSAEAIAALKDEYRWNDVLRNMLEYLRSHFEEIAQNPSDQIRSMNDDGENEEDVRMDPAMKTPPVQAVPSATTRAPVTQPSIQAGAYNNTRPPDQKAPLTKPSGGGTIGPTAATQAPTSMSSIPNPYATTAPITASFGVSSPAATRTIAQDSGLDAADEVLRKAMEAANKAMEQTSAEMYTSQQPAASTGRPPTVAASRTPQHFINPLAPPSQDAPKIGQNASSISRNQHGSTSLAPNGQSHPTHQLYEMAREATTGRPTQQQQPARRTGSQSQRRPWTQEEEKALLDGLDQVKGPHWSMILQLYGPGGKISEVLKDRNQVQLKDKARNLKLWFLKSGGEVPINLRSVTGELKTRAPAAIRNAAAAQAAAQQAQANGSGGTSMSHAPQHAGFDPNHGPYAPSAPPANTASGINPAMPTAGPIDGHGVNQGTGLSLGSGLEESWGNDAADAAAAQVIKDLGADFDFDPASFMDLKADGEAEGEPGAEPKPEAEAGASGTANAAAAGPVTAQAGSAGSAEGKEPDLLKAILGDGAGVGGVPQVDGSADLSNVKTEDVGTGQLGEVAAAAAGENEHDAFAAAAAAAAAEVEAALANVADLTTTTTTTV